MTEVEWLVCSNLSSMLTFLESKASDRKLRLFAVGCCRQVWHLLADPCLRDAVETSERLADGDANAAELAAASDGAWDLKYRLESAGADDLMPLDLGEEAAFHAIEAAAATSCEPDQDGTAYVFRALDAARSVIDTARGTGGSFSFGRTTAGTAATAVAGLLRDVCGNPFRPVVAMPVWLTPTVVALASAAYQERSLPGGTLDGQRLAVLADALEDAGADSELVGHLRGPGLHVRGCWVVDALLAKE